MTVEQMRIALEQYRKSEFLVIAHIAEDMGICYNTYRNFIENKRTTTIGTLKKIVDYLRAKGIHVTDLE